MPIEDVVLGAILGGAFTLFGSWAQQRHSRKLAQADERRERIYAPLFDELDILDKSLEAFERTAGQTKEYERIKAEHILYMVPKKLRPDVVRLYEDLLVRFDEQLHAAKKRLEKRMYDDLIAGGPVGATKEAAARNLAVMAHYVSAGQLPDEEELKRHMQDAFRLLKSQSWQSVQRFTSLEELFEERKKSQVVQADLTPLRRLQQESLNLLLEIRKQISKDLGAEL